MGDCWRVLPGPAFLAVFVALAWAGDAPPTDVEGPVVFGKAGVELDGRTIPWKQVRSLVETDPDPAKLRAQYAERAGRCEERAAAHAALGRWCRENRLEPEAKKEYDRAVALEPEHEAARKALGFERAPGGAWVPAADLLPEKRKALDPKRKSAPLELAAWCREHALFAEEWQFLIGAIVKDAWDRPTIAHIKPIAERRLPKTLLRPPFAGRWQSVVDVTGHHQIKVFALFAIDFKKIDAAGKSYTGTGRALEDHYAFNQPILAAADGVVESVDDHFPDLPIGQPGKFAEANFVVVRHGDGEYSAYGHIRQGSGKVKAGDAVKKGQELARAGNSGASGVPHLHFTAQTPVFDESGQGQWISIPYRFGGFRLVEANGIPCAVEVKQARPQEGWVMECPQGE